MVASCHTCCLASTQTTFYVIMKLKLGGHNCHSCVSEYLHCHCNNRIKSSPCSAKKDKFKYNYKRIITEKRQNAHNEGNLTVPVRLSCR